MTEIHNHCVELFGAHSQCWGGNALLVWLHTAADATIALAYFAIPASLFYLARRHRVKRLSGIFRVYGYFILGCGLTHVFDVVTVWQGGFWLYLAGGLVRAATGVVSVAAAVVTVRCMAEAVTNFTRLAVLERRAAERVRRLESDPRYDTEEDRDAGRLLAELRDLARQAREAVSPGET